MQKTASETRYRDHKASEATQRMAQILGANFEPNNRAATSSNNSNTKRT